MTRDRRFVDSLLHGRSSADLMAAQYRGLRSQVPTMYVAVFMNILFLAHVTARFTGDAAYGLPIALGVIIAARVVLWLLRARPVVRSTAAMNRSMTITVIVAAATSLVLSLWSQSILNHGDAAARSYVALFATLCTISCAACLSSLPAAAYLVAAIGTVPISVSLLLTGDHVLASMGANMLLVSPLVIGMVHRQHQQLRQMMVSHSDMATEKAKVSEFAYRDSLTGLANRRAFLDMLASAVAGGQASTLAVGMIDLDDFKVINDTYGHQAGDALLVETARRFHQLDIGDAVIARLGGDEFAVLLRDVDGPDAAQARLATLALVFDQPFRVGGQAVQLAVSIGIAHSVTTDATTFDLMKCADLAMYEAKHRHATSISLFEPEMAIRSQRRSGIERALATHAENELISLRYQPIIDAATNRIVAFEALARWMHPTLGVIPPAEFIPLAEQAGITAPMTAHLLSQALHAASAWPREVGLSFNLSAGELTSPSLATRILDLLAAHDFDPARLSVEVTETALLSDFATARTVLGALRQGGIRILLDDFGAGYASIGYLREIQFDGIKLDGSLIAALTESPAAHDLLVGVLQLCQAIGAPVTAEMVESPAQHDLLRALGVDHLQGNLLSRALTAEHAQAACRDDRTRPEPDPSSVVVLAKRLPRATLRTI